MADNRGWLWVLGGVALVWLVGRGCDGDSAKGRVPTAYGHVEHRKVNGQWVRAHYDRKTGVTVTDPVATPRGYVRYRKSGWWGSWKAVAAAPAVPVVPVVPPSGSSTGASSSPEPYRGLSEAEKQNIWRQALPKMSFEDREKLRKRGY